MSRQLRSAIAAFCLCICSSTSAGEAIRLSVNPSFQAGLGYSKYILDAYGQISNSSPTLGNVKSELEFPLDVTYAGLRIGISGTKKAARADETLSGRPFEVWSVELGLHTNMRDPGAVMKDQDWVDTPGVVHKEWSYTESKAIMHAYLLSLMGRWTADRNGSTSFGLLGGVTYQNFSQQEWGAHGWQYDEVGYLHELDTNALALRYKVIYVMPQMGVFVRYDVAQALSAELRALFSIVFASDRDDHVLRNRLATSSGSGKAFIGGIRLKHEFNSKPNGVNPFLELDGEVVSIGMHVNQRIEWYGVDPAAPDIPVGTVARGIPHQITSRQGYITVRLGASF